MVEFNFASRDLAFAAIVSSYCFMGGCRCVTSRASSCRSRQNCAASGAVIA